MVESIEQIEVEAIHDLLRWKRMVKRSHKLTVKQKVKGLNAIKELERAFGLSKVKT